MFVELKTDEKNEKQILKIKQRLNRLIDVNEEK